ncbi:MAG: START domain-containing protein, partial [Gammaproteobacteria bacterium]|nr:START domain-containing protein [Gammaproteobacteria bacterium]
MIKSTDWQLVKNKQGITVYTKAVAGSDILKVKTQIIINTEINQIRDILDDAPHRENWIPYLKSSSIVYSYSNTEKLEYSHFSAPWPASDRDFVYRIHLIHHDDNKLIYHMKSENSSLLPFHDDIIRAELIESIYTLTALNEQQTQVELIFHADPKGWLPAWIINIIQKTLPYLILRNLREQALGKY